MQDYKTLYLEEVINTLGYKPLKILDMGSGTSKDWVGILNKYPQLEYTALEFDRQAIAKAKKIMERRPNVQFISDFGENAIDLFQNHFDLVISLSVLEHVKNLEAFLTASVRVLKPLGTLIHRYDLGHALHTESISERLKVFLSKHFPFLISAKKFTTHPDKEYIACFLEKHGITHIETEQHQIPNLKKIVDRLKTKDGNHSLIATIISIEKEIYKAAKVAGLSSGEIDYYFPSITIKGVKAERSDDIFPYNSHKL